MKLLSARSRFLLRRTASVAATGFALLAFATAAGAQVRILSTRVLDSGLQELKPVLQARLHTPVEISIATSPELLARVRKGEAADVVILTRESMQQLRTSGQVTEPTDIAVSLMAVAVADDAPKPVLRTKADFVRFLESTPSIAYTATGPSGVHMAKLLKDFGLEERIGPKATIVKEGLTATLLVEGKVASAIQQVSELKTAGAKNIVLLPSDIQLRTVLSAAVLIGSAAAPKATTVLALLKSREAQTAFEHGGVDPL